MALSYHERSILDMAGGLARLSNQLGKCPHPRKLRFQTKRGALMKAEQVGGMTVYKCQCGYYHMTTDTNADL